MKYFKLYLSFFRNCLIREMMFRGNFVIRILTEIVWLGLYIVFVEVLFSHVEVLAGWTKFEMLLLFGTSHIISQAFEGLFFVNCIELPESIRTGNLDFALIKPINAQFLISTRFIDLGAITNIFIGFIVVGYSLLNLPYTFSLSNMLLYLLLIINGMMIYYAIMFILMTISFWTIRGEGMISVYYQSTNFARQPAEIYRGLLKLILTFVFPMLVIVNFPVKAILNALSGWLVLYGLIAGLILLYASHRFWSFAVKDYRSASS
ncbi:MAG: ABC-2 family transporter protein [bacterium]|nr:ABC-2 family transporter protein [bacterium]